MSSLIGSTVAWVGLRVKARSGYGFRGAIGSRWVGWAARRQWLAFLGWGSSRQWLASAEVGFVLTVARVFWLGFTWSMAHVASLGFARLSGSRCFFRFRYGIGARGGE